MALIVKTDKLGPDPRYVVFGGVSLGCTESPIELKREIQTKKQTCDQYGDEELDDIFSGENITVTATFKEVDAVLLKKLWASVSEIDPDTKPGIGFGTSKIGTSFGASAAKLLLLPIGASEADADKADHIVLWKAYPMPDGGLKFSGKDDKTVTATFKVVVDATKSAKVNKGFWGDYTSFEA